MSVFARIVTRFDVEAAVKENVEMWLPDFVAESARQHNYDPSKIAMPLKPYRTRSRFESVTTAELPMLAITSAGLAGQPRKNGDGSYSAPWSVGIAGLYEAPGDDTARELTGIIGAAVRELMIKRPAQGGVDFEGDPGIASATYWVDERYDDLRPGEEGNRASFREMFIVEVDAVVGSGLGPTEPSTDPTVEPPDWPIVGAGKATATIDRED